MSVIYFKPVLIRLYMTAETLPGKWSVFGFFACLFFTVQPHLVSLSTKISSVFHSSVEQSIALLYTQVGEYRRANKDYN